MNNKEVMGLYSFCFIEKLKHGQICLFVFSLTMLSVRNSDQRIITKCTEKTQGPKDTQFCSNLSHIQNFYQNALEQSK